MATKPKPKQAKRPLWACPKCSQTFVTANVWHSCVNIPVDAHFAERPPQLRKVFDAFVKAARKNGPVTLRSVKTRIALQANTRFAAVTPRKSDLHCHVVLDHEKPQLPVRRVENVGNSYVHSFVLTAPDDVDEKITVLLAEAYEVDRKRHGTVSRKG
jgi:predicted transport protein